MKKRYYIIITLLLSFFVWFYNCLPQQLFNDPVSLILFDKNQELLGAHVAKDGQWRFPETDTINPKFVLSLTTFEDKRFYKHVGVDPLALGRAIQSNFSKNKIVSGASTLSMQTIRMSRKNPSRSYFEKLTEIIRSIRLEIKYSKKDILQIYVSHAPFGGNVVGIDAASWKHYGKPQHQLSWAECATLAVLPNAPGLIHTNRNRNLLLAKRNHLLGLLLKENHIDSSTYQLSLLEPLPKKPHDIPSITPHLLGSLLAKGKSGIIQTSIDRHKQQ